MAERPTAKAAELAVLGVTTSVLRRIQPTSFSPAQRATLSEYLDAQRIEALAYLCGSVKATPQDERDSPNRSVLKKQAIALEKKAAALMSCIEECEPQLRMSVGGNAGGYEFGKRLHDDLTTLISSARWYIDIQRKLTKRGRGETGEYARRFVSEIARVAVPARIEISRSPDTPFFKICEVCFAAGGVPAGPEWAIRTLVEEGNT